MRCSVLFVFSCYAFDLTGEDDYFSLFCQSSVRMALKFAKTVAYAEFENMIEIDRDMYSSLEYEFGRDRTVPATTPKVL